MHICICIYYPCVPRGVPVEVRDNVWESVTGFLVASAMEARRWLLTLFEVGYRMQEGSLLNVVFPFIVYVIVIHYVSKGKLGAVRLKEIVINRKS